MTDDFKATERDAEPATRVKLFKLMDSLDNAHDGVLAVAYLLCTHSDEGICDGEGYAASMLADKLYGAASQMAEAIDGIEAIKTEVAKALRSDVDGYSIASAAHADALTVRGALDRLVTLVVSGELDVSEEDGMDAFTCYAQGIGERVDEVAHALDALLGSFKK